MENNNENQVSTEQYYGKVEEQPVVESEPTVAEEQSYSLEDLHPEEPKPEPVVAPSAAPSTEVQPDPTVINGVKATIGDSSTMVEQTVPSNSFSQNVLEPERIVEPTTQVQQPQPAPIVNTPRPITSVQNNLEVSHNTAPNAKVFYAVIAIILLALVIGIPLYSAINSSLNPSSGKSEPVENNNNNENKENNDNKEEPTTETPVQTPSTPINFDMTLSFDKGLVANEKEVNQKVGYLPTNITGVVRCDFEKPVVMEGITMYGSTYLYYENYKLKSAITVTKQQYPDQALYQSTKDATLIYKTAGDKYDSLDVSITQDDQNYIVTNIMKYNLVYGHSVYIDDIDSYIMFSSAYDTNIKTAIDNALVTGVNNGNSICSSVVTSEAGL